MSRTLTTSTLAVLLASTAGCDSEDEKTAVENAAALPKVPVSNTKDDLPFEFDIEATNGMRWTDEIPKARVKRARGNFVGLAGENFSFRIMSHDMPESGPAEDTDIGYNNSFLNFQAEIEGKRMMIGCHPDRKPKGKLTRTKLDETRVEGSFELELTGCNDYMTGKPVPYDGVPFTAKGTFSVPVVE